MTEAKRIASERRVSRAVQAIGKLNIGEWRETIAIIEARWLSDDAPLSKGYRAHPQDASEFPIADSLADADDAQRVGLAIANLLELQDNDYPGGQIRFDTVHGDRTYEGLARIVARIFEDDQFTLELARRSQS